MKAVFLDRDGVLIENVPDYVRRWDDVVYYDFAYEALKDLIAQGFALVVVTNQSVVGRGLLALDYVQNLNDQILKGFEDHGIEIAGRYMCPHSPEADCDCRKPKPGMLTQAQRELGVDLSQSFFVGDAVTDMQAAQAVGVHGILVRTGRGCEQEAKLPDGAEWPVVDTLLDAARLIRNTEL